MTTVYVVTYDYDGGYSVVEGVYGSPDKAADALGEIWTMRDNAYENGRPGYTDYATGQFTECAPGVRDGRHTGHDGNENSTQFVFENNRMIRFSCEYGFTGSIEAKQIQ